jgi:hypothetical protein
MVVAVHHPLDDQHGMIVGNNMNDFVYRKTKQSEFYEFSFSVCVRDTVIVVVVVV